MRLPAVIATFASLALAGPTQAQTAPAPTKPAGKCQLGLVAEFKVKLDRFRPLIEARINGQPVKVLVDTGAFASTLWTPAARKLGLRLADLPGVNVSGVGGRVAAYTTTIADLELGALHFNNFHVAVLGEGQGDGPALLLGRDILGRTDIEFDLAHDAMRLLTPKGCEDSAMPYWAEKGYSQAEIKRGGGRAAAVELDVQLNGRTVEAILDSGAQFSVATPAAASRSGVVLDGPESKGGGIGPRQVTARVGTLDTFTLGDETIRKAKIRFADLFRGTEVAYTGSRIGERPDLPEMLLGADFLRAHRVLISPSHRKVFFTYEGGPVFDVTHLDAAEPRSEAAPPKPN